LREDWDKLVQASSAAKGSSKEVVVAKASAGASSATAASVPSVPNIVVTDFATVMCLSQGLTKPDAPVVTGASAGVKRTTSSTEDKSVKDSTPAATTSVTKGQKQANEGDLKTLKNVGIVPPRREIGLYHIHYITVFCITSATNLITHSTSPELFLPFYYLNTYFHLS
jgi:hypothetical protein